jgi:hypothetical protein
MHINAKHTPHLFVKKGAERIPQWLQGAGGLARFLSEAPEALLASFELRLAHLLLCLVRALLDLHAKGI